MGKFRYIFPVFFLRKFSELTSVIKSFVPAWAINVSSLLSNKRSVFLFTFLAKTSGKFFTGTVILFDNLLFHQQYLTIFHYSKLNNQWHIYMYTHLKHTGKIWTQETHWVLEFQQISIEEKKPQQIRITHGCVQVTPVKAIKLMIVRASPIKTI